MNKLFLIISILFVFNLDANANFRKVCKVAYMTEVGWSKQYTVEVNFTSGAALNRATNTFNYDAFSIYGIIFWDKEQATVIKISTFLACGQDVTESCITNTIGDLKGTDQDKDVWKICTTSFCF